MKNSVCRLILTVVIALDLLVISNAIIKLNNENKKLKEKVNQLEINYKLYEYDFEQLREYKGN